MIEGFTVTFAGILQTGAGGIVAYVVFMILTGRLVTRKTHEERVQDAKEQTAIWRAAHDTSEAARRENESLVRESLETSRMVLHLVRTIRGVVASEGDGADVAET